MFSRVIGFWFVLLVAGASSVTAQWTYVEAFEDDAASFKTRWKKISSSGRFDLARQGRSHVLLVAAGSNDERVGLHHKLESPLVPGTVSLRAKVRWLQGAGRVWIRLQREAEFRINRQDQDLAKLEYRVAPEWHWRHCWTRYRNGYMPTPQPVDKPRAWNQAQVTGEIHQTLSDVALVIQVQPANRSDNQVFKLQIDAIEVVHTPKASVVAALDQTCWTSGPLFLTLNNSGSDAQMSCELTHTQRGLVWQQQPRLSQGAVVTVEVPCPEREAGIGDYQLRVVHADDPSSLVRQWDVWTPPRAVCNAIESRATLEREATSQTSATAPHFTYWSNTIPGGYQKHVDWASAHVASRVGDQTKAIARGDEALVFYEPRLQSPARRTGSPTRESLRQTATLAFPGQRSIKVLGVHARRDLEDLHVTLDQTQLPPWLVGRVQLRRLLFLPKGTPEQFDYIAGPYVRDSSRPLLAGHNARYALVVELPDDVTPGRLDVALGVTVAGRVVSKTVSFDVLPLTLGHAAWRFGLFSGPSGGDRQRAAFYQDMAAMGLDFPALYNLSPCDLAYTEGRFEIHFERFEKELGFMRAGGVMDDGHPMLIDMRFIQAQITQLSQQLNDSPELRQQTITLRRGAPDLVPNGSKLEEKLYVQVLDAIRQRRSERNDLWPTQMLLMPQDEIEWGRIEQTQRFGKLIKAAGFQTAATSDGIRWGWDGLERLDNVIDYRVYGYVSEDVLETVAGSEDAFAIYTYPHDFVIGWAYYPTLFDPKAVLKWTYYWPAGRYYKAGKPNPSSGTSYAWPGDQGALPSDYTFEISEATRDAALLKLCRETAASLPAGTSWSEVCLQRIQQTMPLDVKVLGQQIGNALPRGNARAWRQVMCAAVLLDRAAQAGKKGGQ